MGHVYGWRSPSSSERLTSAQAFEIRRCQGSNQGEKSRWSPKLKVSYQEHLNVLSSWYLRLIVGSLSQAIDSRHLFPCLSVELPGSLIFYARQQLSRESNLPLGCLTLFAPSVRGILTFHVPRSARHVNASLNYTSRLPLRARSTRPETSRRFHRNPFARIPRAICYHPRQRLLES